MNKAVVFGLLFLLLVVPVVSAATDITVKTVPSRDVTIVLMEPIKQYQLIKSYTGMFSGPKGEVNVVYSGDKSKFHIRVIVKYNNQIVANELFEGVDGMQPIKLDVYPDGYDVPEDTEVEEVVEEPVPVVETEVETPETSGTATGFAVLGDGKKIPSFVYIIALVFIFGVVAFFVMKNRSVGHPREPNPKIFSQAKSAVVDKDNHEDEKLTSVDQKALDEAQKKVEEAQAEINRIKNKDKIREAEERLKKDQDELDKLRTGKDSYY